MTKPGEGFGNGTGGAGRKEWDRGYADRILCRMAILLCLGAPGDQSSAAVRRS